MYRRSRPFCSQIEFIKCSICRVSMSCLRSTQEHVHTPFHMILRSAHHKSASPSPLLKISWISSSESVGLSSVSNERSNGLIFESNTRHRSYLTESDKTIIWHITCCSNQSYTCLTVCNRIEGSKGETNDDNRLRDCSISRKMSFASLLSLCNTPNNTNFKCLHMVVCKPIIS